MNEKTRNVFIYFAGVALFFILLGLTLSSAEPYVPSLEGEDERFISNETIAEVEEKKIENQVFWNNVLSWLLLGSLISLNVIAGLYVVIQSSEQPREGEKDD